MKSPRKAEQSHLEGLPGQLSGELARLLVGLERQKAELGPIADELIDLLSQLGGQAPPREYADADAVALEEMQLNPSSG